MHSAEARHVHRNALLDGTGSSFVRDVPRQPVRFQSGHLVDGRDSDRIRADGATEPRDVSHEGAVEDPKVGSA